MIRTDYPTLPDALEACARADRHITYLASEGGERVVSFAELRQRALGILHHLQCSGLEAGDELILYLPDNAPFIDAFWACLLGGIVPVPVAVGVNDEQRLKLFRIFEHLQRPWLYTDLRTLDRLSLFSAARGLNDELARMHRRCVKLDQIGDIAQPGLRHSGAPHDVAFVQFSSGSTSTPKGVVLTHRNLLSNIEGIAAGARFTDRDVSLSWMPLTHDMGLIGFHLNMLVCGISHCLMPTDLFVRRPLLWLQAASARRATVLCSPNFGYKHVLKVFDPARLGEIDLSPVRLLFNGAEPISAELCERFLERMAPYGLERSAMFPVYGLAEASLAVTFPALGAPLHTLTLQRQGLQVGAAVVPAASDDAQAIRFVGVGHPIRNCAVRIAGDARRALPPGHIGHVLIRGENVAAGYYQDPEATAAVRTDDGWLDTGDLGLLSESELYITGRSKDIIFANGQNYYPHDLEAVAERAAGIELGKVAACGARRPDAAEDEVLLFVVHRGDPERFAPLAATLARTMSEQLGLEIAHVVPVPRLPKTTSGKVQRHLLAESYVAGEHAAVLETLERRSATAQASRGDTRSAIEATLKSICESAIGKPIGADDSLFEAGTTSLTLAQIHERIEETYPGQVDVTDLFDYPSVAALAVYLEHKQRQGLTA